MRPVVPARRDAYVLRMFLGRYPKDYVPRFFAKAQVQANPMQWDLSEVLQDMLPAIQREKPPTIFFR